MMKMETLWQGVNSKLKHKTMTKEEIVALLKRRKEDCLAIAEWSMAKHGHNSQTWNDYYEGMARGIDEALSIIGMLDKQNNRLNVANF